MAAGPDHYVLAEDYAEAAASARDRGELDLAAVNAAIGQVHATLAAASAAALHEEYNDLRMWRNATGQE